MGIVRVDVGGTFPREAFVTTADEGGHVCAIKRAIEFLAKQLGVAVIQDVLLSKQGEEPLNTPMGVDDNPSTEGLDDGKVR